MSEYRYSTPQLTSEHALSEDKNSFADGMDLSDFLSRVNLERCVFLKPGTIVGSDVTLIQKTEKIKNR